MYIWLCMITVFILFWILEYMFKYIQRFLYILLVVFAVVLVSATGSVSLPYWYGMIFVVLLSPFLFSFFSWLRSEFRVSSLHMQDAWWKYLSLLFVFLVLYFGFSVGGDVLIFCLWLAFSVLFLVDARVNFSLALVCLLLTIGFLLVHQQDLANMTSIYLSYLLCIGVVVELCNGWLKNKKVPQFLASLSTLTSSTSSLSSSILRSISQVLKNEKVQYFFLGSYVSALCFVFFGKFLAFFSVSWMLLLGWFLLLLYVLFGKDEEWANYFPQLAVISFLSLWIVFLLSFYFTIPVFIVGVLAVLYSIWYLGTLLFVKEKITVFETAMVIEAKDYIVMGLLVCVILLSVGKYLSVQPLWIVLLCMGSAEILFLLAVYLTSISSFWLRRKINKLFGELEKNKK